MTITHPLNYLLYLKTPLLWYFMILNVSLQFIQGFVTVQSVTSDLTSKLHQLHLATMASFFFNYLIQNQAMYHWIQQIQNIMKRMHAGLQATTRLFKPAVVLKSEILITVKFSDRLVWANSADPDQTARRGAVWSGSTLLAIPATSFGCMTLRKSHLVQVLGWLQQTFWVSEILGFLW